MAIKIWPGLVENLIVATVGLTKSGTTLGTEDVGWPYSQLRFCIGGKASYPTGKWKDLIQSYTARALTASKDKLLAISGIAANYKQIMQRYLHSHGGETKVHITQILRIIPKAFVGNFCGLPLCKFRHSHESMEMIEHNFARPQEPEPARPREYRAPSWSWAAIDGLICYEDRYIVPCESSEFEILECRVVPETVQAPYGAVRSGFLTVKGRMKKVPRSGEKFFFNVVYRPDTERDSVMLTQIMNGVLPGWILEITKGGWANKPKHPFWLPGMPKGLILVVDRQNYRRIGLCSLNPSSYYYSSTPQNTQFGEPRTITIV